jgi:hypothetical protein
MESVGVSTEKEIRSLFGWTLDEVTMTTAKLVEKGLLIDNVCLDNSTASQVCLHRLLTNKSQKAFA